MKNVVEIQDLSYQYENQIALEHISFVVPKGAFIGLLGPNGSGKSTLLKCILGVLPLQSGSVKLFDTDIRKFKDWSKIGYVSQKSTSFNSGFPATVFEVVASGLTPKIGLFKFFHRQHREKVMEALKSVGMEAYVSRNIGELSGGQQQRVFIARTLVADPDLLILDEPTVGVDAENVASFYDMLSDLNKRLGITLIMVTHDFGAVTSRFTHVTCLNRRLCFYGDKDSFENLHEDELALLYSQHIRPMHHHHEGV